METGNLEHEKKSMNITTFFLSSAENQSRKTGLGLGHSAATSKLRGARRGRRRSSSSSSS
jgi:hypothetical protein